MQKPIVALSLLLCAARLLAAEKVFDFGEAALNEPPPGFRSVLAGTGLPGDWKIILDEAPTALPPLSPKAPAVSKRPVVAQLSRDRTDERFPMLVFEEETFGDFTLTTRFKIVDGVEEQMAGIAFRIQDEKNYYYIRASAKGNTFYFFKIVNGIRSAPIGEKLAIARDVWHALTIECKGNQIHALLNGKEVFPSLGDKSFASGKIGFWTKSDSVAYFTDTKITYTRREIFAQVLVRDAFKKYPRLEGLRIFAAARSNAEPSIIASMDSKEVGQPAHAEAKDVIARGLVYHGKDGGHVMVTMPLHDSNGDTVAAVKVVMKSFPGQTEKNAIARALPIVKQMEARLQTANDLVQ